jgi:hypothetical protein
VSDLNSTVLLKSDNIVARAVDDEVILVPIQQKAGDVHCIYTTNDVGSFIWSLIDGKKSSKEIAEAIASEYEISAEEAQTDLNEFVEQLIGAGCIEKLSL